MKIVLDRDEVKKAIAEYAAAHFSGDHPWDVLCHDYELPREATLAQMTPEYVAAQEAHERELAEIRARLAREDAERKAKAEEDAANITAEVDAKGHF